MKEKKSKKPKTVKSVPVVVTPTKDKKKGKKS